MSLPIFNGIIPPLVTPLKDRDSLDVESLEKFLEHLTRTGVHGIFALETTGEGPCMSYRLRLEAIQQVCRIVDSRVPVLISVSNTAYEESVRFSCRGCQGNRPHPCHDKPFLKL